jgi:arginase family enzyme
MSRLRAICPDCQTYTAVALGGEYECHSCGRTFAGGLIRVPKAWGSGGDAMAEAATLPAPYPETAVIAEDTLAMQSLALARELPDRPIVLGGCCCSHIGAVEALTARHGRVALLWFDAHGDLNTPETSPSGNDWGMPLRRLLDSGAVATEDVALIGARNLDPPEEEFIERSRLGLGAKAVDPALGGADGVYVAVDFDAIDESEVASFMPEPGGISVSDVEQVLLHARGKTPIFGVGFSGLTRDERNLPALARLAEAAGF